MITINIIGIAEAEAALKTMAEGARQLGNTRILVGSSLKYAYGIEHGRHRGGRLARRAGGAMMLHKGLESIQDSLPKDIIKAIETGGSVYDAVFKNALRVENIAKQESPVVSGSLRRSFHTVSEGR